MFTLFRPELDAFARKTLDDHRRFENGGWEPAALGRHQLDGLKATLRYVTERSPFYKQHLAAVDARDIDDLTFDKYARLPFTTKDDLRKQMFDILSKPVSDAWIFYETTGTTGRATPCPRDNVDSLVNNTALSVCWDELFKLYGDDQIVGVMGPSELHSTGDTFGDVCRNLGRSVAKMWPHSPVIGFKRALEVMRELPITSVFCTPGMAMSLAKEAAKAKLDPRRDFKVRFFMFTGELATPGLLANIGELWGAKAYNCLYASQEASILGVAHADSRLRTIPLNVYYELIDPETGLPAPEGKEYRQGELVLTHLYQGSKPLVRYRTGDMIRLYPPAPGAAYPSHTMVPIGRARDQIELNGRRVSAYDLENLILSNMSCFDYAVTIDRVNNVDTLKVEFESDKARPADESKSIEKLTNAVKDAWDCPLTVTYGRLGAITSTGAMVSWKAARVHDRRRELDAEKKAALAIAKQRDARELATSASQRWAYHNGEFIRAGEIQLGATTQGLNYGTGVYEGIRGYWNASTERLNLFRVEEHYQRMLASCQVMRLDIPSTARELVEITKELVRRNGHRENAYVRPLAYKVALEPGTPFGVRLRGVSTGFTILSLPMPRAPLGTGIRCAVTSWRRIPDSSLPARAKITGAYANNALGFDEVNAAGYDDAIFLNQRGDVAEASTSNVFLVRNGRLITPGIDADVLEGVTRAAIIDIARSELGLVVEERAVPRSELYAADEVFLTATGKEIAPVIQLDGRRIGSGQVGPVASDLRRLYDEIILGGHAKYDRWVTAVQIDEPAK